MTEAVSNTNEDLAIPYSYKNKCYLHMKNTISTIDFFSPDGSGIPRFLAWIKRTAGIAPNNLKSKKSHLLR